MLFRRSQYRAGVAKRKLRRMLLRCDVAGESTFLDAGLNRIAPITFARLYVGIGVRIDNTEISLTAVAARPKRRIGMHVLTQIAFVPGRGRVDPEDKVVSIQLIQIVRGLYAESAQQLIQDRSSLR